MRSLLADLRSKERICAGPQPTRAPQSRDCDRAATATPTYTETITDERRSREETPAEIS
jgi:hypothetical protein